MHEMRHNIDQGLKHTALVGEGILCKLFIFFTGV